jgi:hypothetical protein
MGTWEGAPMHRVYALFSDAGFDAEATARMGAAFDTAWQILKTADPWLAKGALMISTRETLAIFVIELAKRGVTDPAKLADMAVTRMRL